MYTYIRSSIYIVIVGILISLGILAVTEYYHQPAVAIAHCHTISPTPVCEPEYGQPCTNSNACGSAAGNYSCLGVCNATPPALPPGYGNSCSSDPNICGIRNSGNIACSGSCSVASTPPSDNLCDAPPAVSQGPIPSPECGSDYGDGCTVTNACGLGGDGFIGCFGNCLAVAPSDNECVDIAGVLTPPVVTQVCQSRPNACGGRNEIMVAGGQDCPTVTIPSDASCGVPTFGFRTNDGRYFVEPGQVKTLVWDEVLNATHCRITGGGLDVELTDYTTDSSVEPWVNTLLTGQTLTGAITVGTSYTMTCRNGDGDPTSETIKININPGITEE